MTRQTLNLKIALAKLTAAYVSRALKLSNGDKTQTAAKLHMSTDWLRWYLNKTATLIK